MPPVKLKNLALVLIVLLAFGLRFSNVASDPPALNWDEVSIGYNAYSILKAGHDEWGEFLPIHFKAFGEYKLPVQIYFSIPGIWLFGLNELGVRITPVAYGSLTVLLLFFLVKEILDNEWIGLISAFLLAISPWHIQLTRASFESSFSVFWVVSGSLLLLKAIHQKSKLNLYLILGGLSFAVAIYTYNSARVFAPMFLLFLAWYFRKWILTHKKNVLIAVIIFLLTMIPLVQFITQTGGNSRYKLVSVTDDPGLIPRIEYNRNHSQLPQPLNSLINNRYTYVSFYVFEHYLAHFTPDFLFISGAPHKQHHVQGVGEMYLFQFPLVIYGLWVMFRKKIKYREVVIAWLLLSFVPVSLTNDSIPHALRTLLAVIPYQIISAIGAVELYNYYKSYNRYKYYISALLILSLVISIGAYLYNYYLIYPKLYSRDWQYGYKQAVEYVKLHQSEYDQIVFSRTYGEPHIFLLFFSQYDPAKFLNDQSLVRYEDHRWIWVYHFDKYYFPDLGDVGTHPADWIKQNPKKKILFVGPLEDFLQDQPTLAQVNFLNGTPAFAIVESK